MNKELNFNCGSSSVGRASAFQAEGRGFESRLPLYFRACLVLWSNSSTGQCSSGVEHFHGKEGVGGSIPFIGSFTDLKLVFDF